MGQTQTNDASILPTCGGRSKSLTPVLAVAEDGDSTGRTQGKYGNSLRSDSSNSLVDDDTGSTTGKSVVAKRKQTNASNGATHRSRKPSKERKRRPRSREPSETSASESDSNAERQQRPVQLRRGSVMEIQDRKWDRMLEKWRSTPNYLESHRQKVKWRIRRGIPPGCRADAWALLSGAAERQKANPFLYRKLVSSTPQPHDAEQLAKDFPRFNVTSERQREAIRDILIAICVFEPKLGYVQGMDSTCSMALQYMSPEMTFWLMERLLWDEKYALHGLYEEGMPLAHRMVHIHERLLKKFAPKLHRHMAQQQVEHVSYAFRWLTMRFSTFSFPLASRTTDIFLMEGVKIVFRLAIALLQSLENELMMLDGEAIMMLLRDLAGHPVAQEVDRLIERALGIPVTVQMLNAFAAEYDRQKRT